MTYENCTLAEINMMLLDIKKWSNDPLHEWAILWNIVKARHEELKREVDGFHS